MRARLGGTPDQSCDLLFSPPGRGSVLAELCLPMVRVGGVVVAAKGADPEQEVRQKGGEPGKRSSVVAAAVHGARRSLPSLIRREQVRAAQRAISLVGGGAARVEAVATRGPDGRPFTAVVIRKLRPSGAMYPRPAGVPKSEPL